MHVILKFHPGQKILEAAPTNPFKIIEPKSVHRRTFFSSKTSIDGSYGSEIVTGSVGTLPPLQHSGSNLQNLDDVLS